jgi:hypothetical protein
VRSADGSVESFERARLTAIVPSGERERDYWSADASVGIAARAGNTDSADVTAAATLGRETSFTRLVIDYSGALGTLNGQKNTDNHRVNTTGDVFLTRRIFVTPVSLVYFQDEFQNIDYRITPGLSVGYRLFRSAELDWDVSVGGGYQFTRFLSTPVGVGGLTDGTGVFQVNTKWAWEVTDDIDLDGQVYVDLGVPDVGRTTEHASLVLSIELTAIFDLDVSFNWDRQEDPVEDETGATPAKDDFRLSVGLGVDY